jgi:RNA-directed DNA polymerase
VNKARTDSKSNTVAWQDIPWRKIQVAVFKLQRQIFRASQLGDVRKVRKLQKLLLRSYYAKLLAVRKVTQENQGKKTAGVDGVKSLTPKQRLKLAQNLKVNGEGKPTRRVWIPKPGTEEKRPLGIPTMHDRALQTLVTMALEPEWEAVFEPNSYGFRPGFPRGKLLPLKALGYSNCPTRQSSRNSLTLRWRLGLLDNKARKLHWNSDWGG